MKALRIILLLLVISCTNKNYHNIQNTSDSTILYKEELGVYAFDSTKLHKEVMMFRLDNIADYNTELVATSEKSRLILEEEKHQPIMSSYSRTYVTDGGLALPDVTDSAIDKYPGKMFYTFPDTVEIKKIFRVEVRVARSEVSDTLLISKMDTVGKTMTKAKIIIGDVVGIKLLDLGAAGDTKNFDIRLNGNEKQILENDAFWSWNVIALKKGNNPLKLVVTLYQDDFSKDVDVFEKNIFVFTKPGNVVMDFLKENWQYLISTFLIPLFIWLFNKRKKKEKPSDENETGI